MVLIYHLPVRPIRQLLVNVSQFLAFEGRHSASAGNTGFSIEGHGSGYHAITMRTNLPERRSAGRVSGSA
jgi:hypothetical protein